MKLKICGMTRQEDLELAEELGFDFCGFIFHPQSPRNIEAAAAAGLRSGKMKRVGVFVRQSASEIMRIMETAKLDYAQLHGRQTPADCEAIGAECAIRVLWPQRCGNPGKLKEEAAAWTCAFYLLDAGESGGGSGQSLNWRELANVKLPGPWLLAGGLSHENIISALRACSPSGLDLNSGLEDAPGIKNHAKMRSAVEAVRNWGKE